MVIENGDIESLLRYEHWEWCIAEKHQQPDSPYTVMANWKALDRVGRKLLDKATERMTKQKIMKVIKKSFDAQEEEDSEVDDDVVDEFVYDFWDEIAEGL